MKAHLSTSDQQGSDWQRRVVDRLRKALRPLQWLLARGNTPRDGIDGAKVAAKPHRSVVLTMSRSDQLGASAPQTSWSEREPRALVLIPIRIAMAQPDQRGQRRQRHE